MDWYKHYIGDYQRDTMRLSMEEDGAYRRLLDEYYSTEEPLPLDHEGCFRAARAMTRTERAAVEKILDRYFYADTDGYHHRRAGKEIAKASKQAQTNRRIAAERKAGKASNEPGDEPGDDSYNEPSNEPSNEPLTNARACQTTRLPDYQTPDSRPPDISSPNGDSSDLTVGPVNGADVKAVLEYLNTRTGHSYRWKNPNGKPTAHANAVRAVLKKGYSTDDCRTVISRKADEWENDPKMAKYLTPETLFRMSNFEKYLDQR